MTLILQASLDLVYRAFAHYGCERLLDQNHEPGYGDDVAAELTALLCEKELTDLGEDDFVDYYYLAVDHVGTDADLRHFLPRILDLLVQANTRRRLSVSMLPELLQLANIRSAPAAERDAVAQFLRCATEALPRHIVDASLAVIGGS